MFQNNLLFIILSLVISINLNQGITHIYLNIKKHLILRYELLSDPSSTTRDFGSNKNLDPSEQPSTFFKITCTTSNPRSDSSNICDSIYNYTPTDDRYWLVTTKCGIKNIVFLNIKSSLLR